MQDRLLTLMRLGPSNLLRVGGYRLGLRLGIHPVLHLSAAAPTGPFFAPSQRQEPELVASTRWRDEITLFSAHHFPTKAPPDWHANRFRPGARADATRPWSQIPDFDAGVGDIKTIWECSRFEWLIPMAQRAALGNKAELNRLNGWLQDWSVHNRPYLGVNWKCGQEASIRVLHLAAAAMLLRQEGAPLPGLQAMLKVHLERIAPTMGYAIGQQNNHGTSEAAALFVGGSWLAACGEKAGVRWAATGRKWLEDRARVLIAPDGTFSQYSVVYHRLMLDTYAFAETWRRKAGLPRFSEGLQGRLAKAVNWLYQLTDRNTGDAPNIGANDGARLFPFSDTDYRDFRPSVQWAAVLFCDARAYPADIAVDSALCWLSITPPGNRLPAQSSALMDDGGFAILRRGRAMAAMRYPRFRFRPSHCDALHVDLWVGGRGLLRDAGSFSYAASTAEQDYFAGVDSHNCAAFDGKDQMPRLSRFLFGDWLRASKATLLDQSDGAARASVGYESNGRGCHARSIQLDERSLLVSDELSGFKDQAILRWRLPDGDWRIEGRSITDGSLSVRLETNIDPISIRLTEGWESLYYLEKTKSVVLEVLAKESGTISTKIEW